MSTSASWRWIAAMMPASRDPPPWRMFQASRRMRVASVGDVLAAEPVAPALDVAARRRREVREAAQRAGVAVGLQELLARIGALLRVVVHAHREFRILSLQRRMDQ